MSASAISVSQAEASLDALKLIGQPQYNDDAFNLMEPALRDDSSMETRTVEIRCIQGDNLTEMNSEGQQYEFQWNDSNAIYVPNTLTAQIEFTVSKAGAGGNLDANDVTSWNVVENVFEMFSRSELTIGSTIESDIQQLGKADSIQKLLYTGKEYVDSVGSLEGFVLDEATRKTRFLPAATKATKKSIVTCKIPIGFFADNKKNLKGVTWRLKLFRAPDDAFFYKTVKIATSPKLTINKIVMFMDVIIPNAAIDLQYSQMALQDYTLQYTSFTCDRLTITDIGVTDLNMTILNTPAIPKFIFLAFSQPGRRTALSADAIKLSPSSYDHVGAQSINLYVNGSRRVPNLSKNFDFTTGVYNAPLYDLYKITAAAKNYDRGNLINFSNFSTDYPIFGFDLRGSNNSDLPELNKQAATITMQLRRGGDATGAHDMYIVCVYDTVMHIKGNTNIITKIYGN